MARRKKRKKSRSVARRPARTVTKYKRKRAARKTSRMMKTAGEDGAAVLGGLAAFGVTLAVLRTADEKDGKSIDQRGRIAPWIVAGVGVAVTIYDNDYSRAAGHGMIGAGTSAYINRMYLEMQIKKIKEAADKAGDTAAGTAGGDRPGSTHDPAVEAAARRLGLSAPPAFREARPGYLEKGDASSAPWSGGRQRVRTGYLATVQPPPTLGGVGFLAVQSLP